jgi:hypothetical protein
MIEATYSLIYTESGEPFKWNHPLPPINPDNQTLSLKFSDLLVNPYTLRLNMANSEPIEVNFTVDSNTTTISSTLSHGEVLPLSYGDSYTVGDYVKVKVQLRSIHNTTIQLP